VCSLRCAGVFNNGIAANYPQSMPVKKIKICQYFGENKFGGMFYESRCRTIGELQTVNTITNIK